MVRTLLIGLDGATFTVLDSLLDDQGPSGPVMPYLRSWIERGFRATLRSTPHPLTPPAWVSMITGRSPGHHGIFDFVRFEDSGDDVYFTLYDARDIRAETLWSMASRQGRSVASLNFPMMAPPKPVNGSLVPGFVSWKHLRHNMTPEHLYDRIRKLPGFKAQDLAWDFEREAKIGDEMPTELLLSWVRGHLPREEQWFRIAEMLMAEDQPDLFAVMFDGTDKIQHQAWQALDPACAGHWSEQRLAEVRALALSYFRQLDGFIQRLVDLAGPQAQVFIASDHGFTGCTEVLRINRYLGERGYLTWKDTTGSELDRRREASNFAHLDWSRTTAFCPTPSSNGIWIRRQTAPGGPGVPTAEYESFRQRLIQDLRDLRSPATGEPMIKQILLREEVFPGAASDAAPDLTLVLRDHGFVSVRNLSPAIIPRPTPFGTHHPDGIFIAGGPGVAGGRTEPMSILDIAPILLHSLDLPVPENLEGQIPAELFTRRHLVDRPVRVGPPTSTMSAGAGAAPAEDTVPEDEKQRILDQLRVLGYLED